MKVETRIIAASVLLGLLMWLLDTLVDYLFFFQGTFMQSFMTAVAPHDAYLRVVIMVVFPVFGLVVARGVSHIRMMEEALEQSDAALMEIIKFNQTLIDNLPYGMKIVNEHGHILYVNKRMEEFMDGEAIDKKCWETFKNNGQQCNGCPLRGDIKIGSINGYTVKNASGGKNFMVKPVCIMYNGKKAMLEIFEEIESPAGNRGDL